LLFTFLNIVAGHYYISKTSTKWGEENCQLATPELRYNNETRWHYIVHQTLPKNPSWTELWINYIQQAYNQLDGKTYCDGI